MPKINFNTPFLNEAGDPVMKVKVDEKKTKFAADGRAIPHIVTDEEGNAIQEASLLKDMLVAVLHRGFPGDESLAFDEKARRGKLARKIARNSSAHYTDKEIELIKELTARAGSTMMIAHIDDLVNDTPKAPQEKTEEKSAA